MGKISKRKGIPPNKARASKHFHNHEAKPELDPDQEFQVLPKRKTGAPLKWTEETIDKTVTPALEKYLELKLEAGSIPWENEFAYLNHLSRADFDDKFAVRSERFRSALRNLREQQQHALIHGGLTEKTNPAFTQFVLRNKHRDVFNDDTKLIIDGGLPAQVNIIHGVIDKATANTIRSKQG